MNMIPCLVIILVVCFFSHATGCNKKSIEQTSTSNQDEAHSDKHQDEAAHEELPNKIKLSEKLSQTVGIKLYTVKYETLDTTIELTGEIAQEPDKTADISARVSGRIVQLNFKEGERVRKGKILAIIESSDLAQARAQLSSTQAKSLAVGSKLKRLKQLMQDGLASKQEIADAEADFSILNSEMIAAKLKLSAFGAEAIQSIQDAAQLKIHSPIDGDILKRQATLGQAVNPNDNLAVIANLDNAHFVARVLEKDLMHVKMGSNAEVRLNAYPQDVFLGTVETIGKQLDALARTVVARIKIKNRNDLLKVGLFGTTKISIPGQTDNKKRLVILQSAITRLADKDVVFVKHEDGDFEVHPVTLGISSGGKVEILNGLRENEQIVVDGVFTLKSIVLKSTFGEDE